MAYFKTLHLCKFVLYPCLLKWTHASEPLCCLYISPSAVNSIPEHVHSVDHITASELFLLTERTETVEQIYTDTRPFQNKTCVAVKITFLRFCPRNMIQCKFQNQYRPFVTVSQPSSPIYSFSLQLNPPSYSTMFPSNTNFTGTDRCECSSARNWFLTKLKYNPTKSNQK
jgi:hypothetical protein